MKKQFIILVVIFLTTNTFLTWQTIAQAPEQMKYQAVARDNGGNVLSNQLISFQISILQGSSTGTSVYTETHLLTSNDFGLANLTIGTGTIESGIFSSIDWSSNIYFLQVEMDETGGTTFQLMGTSQLLSVPYALHAKTADALTSGNHSLTDSDGNTKIQLEKTPNDDIIRFDIGGTEQWIMTETRIEPKNSGGSVFIGHGAGANDDLSDNQNVAIGLAALGKNTDRSNLVAIGDSALYNNGTGSTFYIHARGNTAIGSKSLYSNTTGFENTAIGFEVLYNNTYGSLNTANGFRSMTNNTSGYYNTAFGNETLFNNTTGGNNAAIGVFAMGGNISGGGNTAVGYSSLVSNTDGGYNTAIGMSALYYNIHGNENTATGYLALYNNTQSNNTATGSQALYSNTIGVGNVAIGHQTLYSNTTGNNNTASGSIALYENTSGQRNTATGAAALNKNETGNDNTAIGWAALTNNIDGDENTATGRAALFSNTTGNNNTANGKSALYYNTEGYNNTATGYKALVNNTIGDFNTANGREALKNNSEGNGNTANGTSALSNNDGDYNTATGYSALNWNATGGFNTAIGVAALSLNISGSDRTALGHSANSTGENYNNNTGLGADAYCTASEQVRIGSSSVSSIGGYANWSNVSDKQFNTNIEENVEGLAFIEKLRPVTYNMDLHAIDDFFAEHYNVRDSSNYDGKYDKEQIRYTGFIAEEVEEAARELGYDFSGVDPPKNENDFYALRYAEFVVPLVKGMQEQQDIIQEQQVLIETLISENQQMKENIAKINSILEINTQK